MYRIDKFLEYYNSLSLNGVKTQISPGIWVNARPIQFCYGVFTKEFWRERKQRKKDAKAIMSGKAVAVTWESDL